MVLNKGLHRWREQKEAQAVLHFFPGRTSLFHYFQPLKLSPFPPEKPPLGSRRSFISFSFSTPALWSCVAALTVGVAGASALIEVSPHRRLLFLYRGAYV